jgi:uncharacterized protein (DUF1800 family)
MKKLLIAMTITIWTMTPALTPAFAKPANTDENILHALDRLSFGPRPGDMEAVHKRGINAYIKDQLNPDHIEEDAKIQQFVGASPALTLSATQLYNQFGPPAVKQAKIDQNLTESADDKKKLNQIKNDFYKKVDKDITDAKLMRAIESPRQLQEVMTEFWYNHFNVFANKDQDRYWIGAYEQQAIRPYALGKFRDLLEATCHHPAMLFYLDNWQNTASGFAKKGRFAGLNENYARELMELHSLGVDGGYTQKDVTELARILTGLGLPERNVKNGAVPPESGFGYHFEPKRHDQGDKVILGNRIAAGGEEEIEQALDLLAENPATAHHISYQLAQFFVSDEPPATLVVKLQKRFTKSGGNIKAVLTELFKSPEFWDTQYYNAKFKNPFRFVVSTVRATNSTPSDFTPLEQFLRQQGMPIYGCLTPDGYKNTTQAWLNPDSLLRRTSFAMNVASGKYKGMEGAAPDYKNLEDTFGNSLSDKTEAAIKSAPDNLKPALVLGSPDFMHY